mmetsp:Transcript_127667/g.272209  ORF Transcript_127667/g.272209 Transcript_127667/m.272209 type:complete len:170 (-) Transcript_127667:41-550(-)
MPLFRALLLALCSWSATAQRAFKISSSKCTLSGDSSNCQISTAGDAALQVEFAAGAETTLTLDMSSSTTCSASSANCPQVFIVESDDTRNVIKISKCSWFKQADYSSHLLTYTFMNVGTGHTFTVKDDHDKGRATVPPGAVRECYCYCKDFCNVATNNRLYCLHNSPGR